MTIDTLNLVFSIGELIVFIILFVYLLRKTDWKREHEYERFRDSIGSEKLPKDSFSQPRKKVNPGSASTPHRSPLD
jgi:hypothetical protein